MKIGLVGHGGREHALAMALRRGENPPDLAIFMGAPHPGLIGLAACHAIGQVSDPAAVRDFFRAAEVEWVLIGPEAPLAAGVVDALETAGIPAIGPTQAQARLESDKAWMRAFLRERIGRGSPKFLEARETHQVAPFLAEVGAAAVKPVGLTAGKGVRVFEAHEAQAAQTYAESLIAAEGRVLIEERLEGEECSLIVLSDGAHLLPLPLAQDFKRVHDGDRGGMTGGMGAYTCADGLLPFVTIDEREAAFALMRDVIHALAEITGRPYRGALYGQFMLTAHGPVLIEFNVRFGDPEAINLMAVLDGSLAPVAEALLTGSLGPIPFRRKASVSKYLAPPGYPNGPVEEITFKLDRDSLAEAGIGVALASVAECGDGLLRTTGARALALFALDETPGRAAKRIDSAIGRGDFHRLHFRREVGAENVIAAKVDRMRAWRAQKRN